MHKRQPVIIIFGDKKKSKIAESKTAASRLLGVSRTKLDSHIESGTHIDKNRKITVDLLV
ncbi:MAG: hypothetical protein WDA09_06980 [Bacteriovoracaceae bacterium]